VHSAGKDPSLYFGNPRARIGRRTRGLGASTRRVALRSGLTRSATRTDAPRQIGAPIHSRAWRIDALRPPANIGNAISAGCAPNLTYRPVVFELLPPEFTLTRFATDREAISGGTPQTEFPPAGGSRRAGSNPPRWMSTHVRLDWPACFVSLPPRGAARRAAPPACAGRR